MQTAAMAMLLLFAEPAPRDNASIELSVRHQAGHLLFQVKNNTKRTLNYSGHVYGTPPAPNGGFYLSVYDVSGKAVRQCMITDRFGPQAHHRVRPGATATISEFDDDLFNAYCLKRNRTYQARLFLVASHGTRLTVRHKSNAAPLRW